jgi:intein/homing endonuclease
MKRKRRINMDEKIIKLIHSIPVKTNGTVEHINEIKLGRFKVKHLKYIPKYLLEEGEDKSDISPEDMIPLLAGLSELPESAIGEIDLRDDFNNVMTEFTDFFEVYLSQETGSK